MTPSFSKTLTVLLMALASTRASPTTPHLEKCDEPLGFTLYSTLDCQAGSEFSPSVFSIPSNLLGSTDSPVYQKFGTTKPYSIKFNRDLIAGEKIEWFVPKAWGPGYNFDPSTHDTTERCEKQTETYQYVWGAWPCFSPTRIAGGWETDEQGPPLTCFKYTIPANRMIGILCEWWGMCP